MKKFLVLYKAPRASFEQMMKSATPEMQQKGMQAWMGWMQANQASMVDGGAPLGKGRRIDAGGAKDDPNELGGYSIVRAETIDAAGKLFGKDHPHMMMPGGWIEIVEIMPVPGM